MISAPPRPLTIIPHTKPMRLLKGKRMTIAIGMLCESGLILAADTRITNPLTGATYDAVKIQQAITDTASYIAVYASENSGSGESLTQSVLSELEHRNPPSLSEIQPIVESTMAKWSKAYILKDDRPSTEIVLGAFLGTTSTRAYNETGLFWCEPPKTVTLQTFQNTKGYVAAGSGKAITTPFFNLLFGDLVSPRACLCEVSYLMHRAKTDYAAYCGGETDAVLLHHERRKPVWIDRLDMKMAESFGDFFDEALASMARFVISEIDWSNPKETVGIFGIMSHIGLAFQRLKFRSRDRTNPFDL